MTSFLFRITVATILIVTALWVFVMYITPMGIETGISTGELIERLAK